MENSSQQAYPLRIKDSLILFLPIMNSYLDNQNVRILIFIPYDGSVMKEREEKVIYEPDDSVEYQKSSTMSTTLISIGLALAAFFFLADFLGYGTWDEFGIIQIAGTVGGVVMIFAGLVLKAIAGFRHHE